MTGSLPALPTGGGALSGIGETFQPDLHTGTGNLTVPLPLPPGRGALTPHLDLIYSSGNGNSPFGLGWSLQVPKIARRTDKGIPTYDDGLDVFVLSGAEELVPVPLGSGTPPDLPDGARAARYRPRTEAGFARIVHVSGGGDDYWDVWTPDGLRSRYGTQRSAGTGSDWADPAAVRSPEGQVFSWLLTKTQDTLGNTIAYTYIGEPEAQRYLSSIDYADYGDPANAAYAITITIRYDPTPRPDPFTDRKPGFALTTSLRATAIDVTTVGSGGAPATTVQLAYQDDTASGISLLQSIQVIGHDAAAGTDQHLPPLTFGYSDWNPTAREYRTLAGPLPPPGLGPGMDLMDLFAEGLPSVLELNGTARYWRNRGGWFDQPRDLAGAPTGAALGAPGTLMADLDGDGRPEITVGSGTAAFTWHLKDPSTDPVYRAGFAPPTPAGTSSPGIDATDPTTRLIDLTGTHIPDLLLSGTAPLTASGDGRGGFNQLRPLPDPPPPATDLADPRVHLADMTGDGLTDLVLIHDGAIRYWPNLGNGRFDNPITMAAAPHFSDAAADPVLGFDPGRLLLGDVTGDGTADAIYVGDGTTTLWLNRSGNGFSPPAVIRGTPRVSNVTSVRLADIDGAGIAGILWTGLGPAGRWAFLNLTGGTKPYLLTEIDNHHGASTTLTWSTSTAFATADREAGRPWRTSLPFPVHVLASTVTRDFFAHTLLTEQYSYHEGYWDPVDREFRGFSRVEHTDTLTPTQPAPPAEPTLTPLDPLIPPAPLPDGFDPALHGNLLANWSFDLSRNIGPTTLTTTADSPYAAGMSAAADWTTWNNAPAATTTALEPSTLPQGAGGAMLHVTTTAGGCGIVQTFLPADEGPARAVSSAWVYVLRGSVQIGTGNGGDTGADAICQEQGQWTLVQAGNSRTPANEIIIYAADPDGAEFYVDHAWARADTTPGDPLTSAPLRTVTWFHPGPVGTAHGPWITPDSSADYWQEDAPLRGPIDLSTLPDRLPRSALREALRGLRGLVLRTETYSDDGSAELRRRPFEIHDSVYQIAPVLDGRDPADASWLGRPVITVRTILSRAADWDRGSEPMTHLTTSGQYDDYGRAHATVDAGVPRGRDPRAPGEPCLATTTQLEYATRDDAILYRLDCVARKTRNEAIDPGTGTAMDFLTEAITGNADGMQLALELSYYDGEAFIGLPNGELGDHGLPTHTESLTITPDLLTRITQPAVPGGTECPPIPYLPAAGAPPADWGPQYPDGFQDSVLKAPASRGTTLGYVWHDATPPFSAGYYTQTSRLAFDVQQPEPGVIPRGVVMAHLDAFGGATSTTWDEYRLFVSTVTDPVGLTSMAEYDYRVLKPSTVTDANGNRSRAGYTPLGLPAWIARLGKDGLSEGDTVEQPGQSFTYDLTAWDDSTGTRETPEPIRVTTVKRVDHRWTIIARVNAARAAQEQPPLTDPEIQEMFGPTEQADHPERFIQITQYSDGHGRLLQSRTQADDIIVSDLGLPPDGTAASDTVSADAPSDQPRVVVSAWKVYDNKGRPILTYEPFYDFGYRYLEPDGAQLASLARVRHHYDPKGRPTLTIAPDGSETLVVYGVPAQLTTPEAASPTPWETYTYSPDDNAGRTHPTTTLDEADHWDTPSNVARDALGRVVRMTERGLAADVVTTHAYDVDGRLLSVTDPIARLSAQRVYDLAGREWLSWLLDAGAVRTVHDPSGGIIERGDDRLARSLTGYDEAHRANRTWAADRSGQQATLRHRTVYGDEAESGLTPQQAATANALGRVVTTLDEAGRLSTAGYDLDGNPIAITRQILRPEILLSLLPPTSPEPWANTHYPVDWPSPDEPASEITALLDPTKYTTQSEFDSLGRTTSTTFPTDATGARARADFSYSRCGGLASITVDKVLYLNQAIYDARGRRTLQIAGSGVLERYLYDAQSSRLRRHYAQHTSSSRAGTWRPDGPVLADQTHRHDLAGNLLAIVDQTPGCGVPPADPDRLDRRFIYDPLGRLTRASGRETDIAPAQPWIDIPRGSDTTKARAYREAFLYDSVGNLLQLQHTTSPDGSYTRMFSLSPSSNKLASLTSGASTVTYQYDAAGSMISEASNRFFEWDHTGHLATFRDQAGTGIPSVYAQYRYSATGERVVKIVRRSSGPDEVTIYIGGFERIIRGRVGTPCPAYDALELTDSGIRLAHIRRGDSIPDDPLGAQPAIYYLTDHLCSVTATISIDGLILNQEEYLPYGETAFGSYARKRYRYTGRERDEESGFSYHRARYYAPALCRWSSCDPIGSTSDANLYRYCHSNPMMKVDISGTAADDPPKSRSKPPKAGRAYQEGTFNQLRGYKINGTEPTIREHPAPQAQLQKLTTNPRTGTTDYHAHGREGGKDAVYLSPEMESYEKTHKAGSVAGDNARTKRIQILQDEAEAGRGPGAQLNEDIIEPSIIRATEAGAPHDVVVRTVLGQAGNLFGTYTLAEAGAILRTEQIARIATKVTHGLGTLMGVYGAYTSARDLAHSLMKDVKNSTSYGQYTTREIASQAGGWTGALVMGEAGAAIGATMGLAVPIIGSIVGGFLGGAIGGAAGYILGSQAATNLIDAGVNITGVQRYVPRDVH